MPHTKLGLTLVAALAAAATLLLLPSSAAGATHARPALSPLPSDGLSLALRRGRIGEALYALERARALFDRAAVATRYGTVARPDPRSGTMVLRDLVLRFDELSAADQRVARSLLARPTVGLVGRPDDDLDPSEHHYSPDALANYFYLCPAAYCVNWVEASSDAVALTDDNANGLADYVEDVVTTMNEVWQAEIVQMGYRPPKLDVNSPDPNHLNVDGRLDVYLTDLGADGGLFGYCTTDDPNAFDNNYPGYDASAYCVLDNDYAVSQYGDQSGLFGLQATAAHEFFHAVQFAYNFWQDRWLLEGAAAWMEGQVYGDLDSAFPYIGISPVLYPDVPLDLSDLSSSDLSLFKYGTWTFFQYLSETGGPQLIREIFEAGDGIPGARALYAVFAIDEAVLAASGGQADFRSVFADYGVANIAPELFYDEGGNWIVFDNGGNPAQAEVPLPGAVSLTRGHPSVGPRGVLTDHLTNAYRVFRPGIGVKPSAKLRFTLNLPPGPAGPEASLVSISRSGKLTWRAVRLNAQGDAVVQIPFGRTRIIILVLTNASTRFADCERFAGSVWVTCGGTPLDDNRSYVYTARLVGG
jgi:hypothetical protein